MSYRVIWSETGDDAWFDTLEEAQAAAIEWATDCLHDRGEGPEDLPVVLLRVGGAVEVVSAEEPPEGSESDYWIDGYRVRLDVEAVRRAAIDAGLLPEQSLHAQALAACKLATTEAMTDRELAIALLEWGTRVASRPGSPRWATYPLAHGSGMSQALLRAASIDPDEECRPRPEDGGEE